jgi:shikimate dehydrogenase
MADRLRFAVLGDPISHSRSPAIHTAAMSDLGIDGTYVAIRAGLAELREVVEELRRGAWDGINVTMPIKFAAAEASDLLTDAARVSGSVNSLRLRRGRIEGHSTDVTASGSALGDSRFPSGAPVLVLGSGGAAAAALGATTDRAVYASSRSPEKLDSLLRRVGVAAGVVPFGSGVAGAIVVNATPLGMGGEKLPEGILEVAGGLVDLPYGAGPTGTVEWATRKGLPVMDGIEFLVLQAADAFRWWTGVEPPFDVMLRAGRNV